MNHRRHYDHRRTPAAIRALAQWSSHSQPECAIALAFGSAETRDWKVDALLWLYSGEARNLASVAYRLALAAEAAANIARIRAKPEVIEAAVRDAMGRVRRDRSVPSARERSLSLRISNQSYTALRTQAEKSLRRGLTQAMERYLIACDVKLAPNSERKEDGQVVPIARAA